VKNSLRLLPIVVFLVSLSAHAQTAKFSSSSVSFPNTSVGSTASQNLTLTNAGSSPLVISSIAASGPSFRQTNNCAASLAPNSRCTITAKFSPTTATFVTGSITLQSNDTVKPTQNVALSGTGIDTVSLTPSSVSFGSVNVGSTSSAKAVALTNNGKTTLSVSSIVASGNFSETNNCGNSVNAGKKCIINTYFKPSSSGPITGTLTVTDGAGQQVTQVSGTGVAVLQSITVTPANFSTPAGKPVQFLATGRFNDGSTQNLTSSVSWASSNAAAASISAAGLASALNVGTTTISASSGSVSGSTALTVTPAVLVSIVVTPANATLVAPAQQQYTATGNYTDGSQQNLTNSVTWTSSTEATAAISASGLATTGIAGTTTISTTSGAIVGSTVLAVTHIQTGIALLPASANINTGDSQQFNAYPTYSDGTTSAAPVGVTWSSSSTAVAQIDVNGLAVGDVAGSATIGAVSGSFSSTATIVVSSQNACANNNRTDMKLLVLTNHDTEADYPAITTTLNYLHMPYDVFDYSTGPVTQNMLYSGCHAFYNGIIVAFLDGTAYNPGSTPPAYPFAGYDVLQTFEQTFAIRQVNWYVVPSPSLGFNWSTGSQEGDSAAFNSQTAPAVFPYVNQNNPLIIDPHAYVYLATASGGTALLSDASGNALMVSYSLGDGREYLSLTFDSNQYMKHEQVLSYGLLTWVTKGLFVGEKHIYFTAQIDDWGIDDDIWALNPQTQQYPACGTAPDQTGMTKRIAATDADALVAWQNTWQANPIFANFKLYQAFNGCGFGTNDSNCSSANWFGPNDTLTQWTLNSANTAHFGWINHTYEHPSLDGNSVPSDSSQLSLNIKAGQNAGFVDFSGANLVTPGITGLNDANALQAMVDNGVGYVVSDTSCVPEAFVGVLPTCDTSNNNGPGPGFNKPIINSIQPSITEVPRRPNNLFFNVGDPNGWQNEYRCIYASTPPYNTYTEQQINDFIANSFVSWMLEGDADPQMFHQTNLSSYDGTHSLLSDLLDDTFKNYLSYFNLPVRSMSLDTLGQFMLNNQAMDTSGIVGTINNGSSRTITLTVAQPATIPVTGLQSTGAELYGGQSISHVALTAREILTLRAP